MGIEIADKKTAAWGSLIPCRTLVSLEKAIRFCLDDDGSKNKI